MRICKLHPRSILHTLALALTLSFTSLLQAGDLDAIQARGYLHVVTEDDFRPFEFVDNGKPSGFNHDMIAELRQYAPFEIRSSIIPWAGMMAALSAGRYDAAVTGTIVTTDRLKAFNFVAPTAAATHYFIRRADDESLASIADLDGKTVGVQAGSAQLARLPELQAMLERTGGKLGRVVEYPSYPEVYADLASGRLDYAINTIIGARAVVEEHPGRFALGLPVSGPGFHGWMIAKDRPEVLAFLTDFVNHLRDSGRLGELQAKWFGQDFPELPREAITSAEQFHSLTTVD
ncbi:transporter substrate-binding domain-containing protein [Phytopseudomonas daroniae]|uniref:transporter substrate-binding domain-containing protein n=1 Tax=Phytopseudomonas daroniae TaxID=2487519 RepID=UPI0010385BAB|nr:transporter substrate-binding domain-containing protein [Pseudomonas daroniae]TBU75546.1 amino acid ABC transporter substrate-binding protein [Pseudomonas daroniae]